MMSEFTLSCSVIEQMRGSFPWNDFVYWCGLRLAKGQLRPERAVFAPVRLFPELNEGQKAALDGMWNRYNELLKQSQDARKKSSDVKHSVGLFEQNLIGYVQLEALRSGRPLELEKHDLTAWVRFKMGTVKKMDEQYVKMMLPQLLVKHELVKPGDQAAAQKTQRMIAELCSAQCRGRADGKLVLHKRRIKKEEEENKMSS